MKPRFNLPAFREGSVSMAVRAVFFDLGGVILRTEYQAPREHLAERLNMTYEDLVKIVFESETSRQASSGRLSTDQHWGAVVKRLARPASETGNIREEFFAGDVLDRTLVQYIRSLRPAVKTALLSNAWPDMRQYIVQQKFEDAFDALVLSAEVGIMKPDPAIFHFAMDKLGVAPTEAAFVDDTALNVEAARALGMHGIVFSSFVQMERELSPLLT
jgi:epoxide hydrolase-like predicted phosphatase